MAKYRAVKGGASCFRNETWKRHSAYVLAKPIFGASQFTDMIESVATNSALFFPLSFLELDLSKLFKTASRLKNQG